MKGPHKSNDEKDENKCTLESLLKFSTYVKQNMQRLIKSEYLMNPETSNENPKFSVCFFELSTFLESDDFVNSCAQH